MWPVHTWLPDAHVQAPTGGSVILAAVMLKLGTYAYMRFSMGLFPGRERVRAATSRASRSSAASSTAPSSPGSRTT
jgi:NADH:ubiquinone oxidoreductase subunit 4 (subunit M)